MLFKQVTGLSIDAFVQMLENMLVGSGQALGIFALTVLFAVPLGVFVALGRGSRVKLLSGLIRVYQLICRGTPLMLQLLFFMYGPFYMFGVSGFGRFTACVLAFVVNYAAYFGEIFRSGINSIPQGQYEAGKVLGYTKSQTFRRIILPQVIKRVIPPMGNEFMTLVKDTALAQIIAQPQLFDVIMKTASGQASVTPYIIGGAFYLVMSAVVEMSFKTVETRLDYYK